MEIYVVFVCDVMEASFDDTDSFFHSKPEF